MEHDEVLRQNDRIEALAKAGIAFCEAEEGEGMETCLELFRLVGAACADQFAALRFDNKEQPS